MTAARPHDVNVKSWHHKDKKQYAYDASAAGIGESVEIEHHHNGRNQSQVETLAKSRLKDAIRHDCNVVVKAPGDLSVNARMKFQLTGTGTVYDQAYDIDSVTFVGSHGAELHPGQMIGVKVTDFQAYDLVAEVPRKRSRSLAVVK